MAPFTELNTVVASDFTSLVMQTFVEGPMRVSDLPAAKSLMMERPFRDGEGDQVKLNEVDSEQFARFMGEGDTAKRARHVMGYNKTFQFRRYGIETAITWNMRKYSKYPEVTARLTDLSVFCPNRFALDLVHVLTFCTAVSYTDMDGEIRDLTVGDGFALVYSLHTLTGSSSTYSNVITGNPQFSKGSFQIAKDLGSRQSLDNFGIPVEMGFDTVVSTDDATTLDEINILKRSTADPMSGNSGVVNTYQNSFKSVVLKRLDTTATGAKDSTKTKYWGYAATSGTPGQRWCAYYCISEQPNLKYPSAGNNLEDGHTDNWIYGARMSYLIGVLSGRGLLWSTGLGA